MDLSRPLSLAFGCLFLILAASGIASSGSENIEHRLHKLKAGDHPRLLVEKDTFLHLRKGYREDPQMRELVLKLEARAKKMMQAPPITYQKTGRRLLSVSRMALDRILLLSTLDQITQDKAYGERAIEEMQAAVQFKDWNPSHFLDTAEMTLALSIGYDWLYDRIPEEERQRIREAILTKGLKPSLSQDWWWIDTENNWNQVCHGGMIAGALVTAEAVPDIASQIIRRAIENVPHAMHACYAPNGTYPEGIGYWNYGTTYNVLLIAMLQTALDDDFGLLDQPGFSATGDYYHSAHTPAGRQFSYADARWSEKRSHLSPALIWLSKAFNRPDWVSSRVAWFGGDLNRLMGSAYSPLLLLWGQGLDLETPVQIPLDWEGKGEKPVATHRSGWGLEDVYVGICAGQPASNHGHMDIGSFVFESDGISWVRDLGYQGYHSLESQGVGLWDMKQNGQRWDIFRLGPFSHNTLTINDQKQQVKGFTPIASFSPHPDHPASVLDLSATYQKQARRLHRGIQLFNRSHLIVRDQLEQLTADSQIRWALTTAAEIKVAEPRRAILTSGNQTLIAHLVEPEEAAWEILDISEGPQPWDAANPGMRQLIFKTNASKDDTLTLTVILETGRAGAPTQAEATGWNFAPVAN